MYTKPGVRKEAGLLNYYVTRLGGQVLLPSKILLGFSWVSVSAALHSALALTSGSLCVETILGVCLVDGLTVSGFLLTKTALCVSVLPCDLLVESGVKIGKVCEFGEKSVSDKSDCGGRVGGLLMVELGVIGGLNCSAFSLGCARKHNGGPGPVDQNGVSFAEVLNGTA